MIASESMPAEGWSGPDERGVVRFVRHGYPHGEPPVLPGYTPFFVAVHGERYTRWSYVPCGPGHIVESRSYVVRTTDVAAAKAAAVRWSRWPIESVEVGEAVPTSTGVTVVDVTGLRD